jgi:hypothetical protein
MRLETARERAAIEKKAREDAIQLRQQQQAARNDSYLIDTIMHHLYRAGQTLLHGRIGTAEKIKHEMSKIMHTIETTVQKEAASSGMGLPEGAYSISAGPGELKLPDATSVQHWNQAVEKLIPVMKQQHSARGCLPTDLKKHLADMIKQGKLLSGGTSSVASQARAEIGQAAQLYVQLSGTSFL